MRIRKSISPVPVPCLVHEEELNIEFGACVCVLYSTKYSRRLGFFQDAVTRWRGRSLITSLLASVIVFFFVCVCVTVQFHCFPQRSAMVSVGASTLTARCMPRLVLRLLLLSSRRLVRGYLTFGTVTYRPILLVVALSTGLLYIILCCCCIEPLPHI